MKPSDFLCLATNVVGESHNDQELFAMLRVMNSEHDRVPEDNGGKLREEVRHG